MKQPIVNQAVIWHDLRTLFLLSLPIASAYFPLSVALGLYAISAGLPVYAAPVASLFIYAGSAEFLAVEFMAKGVSLATVAWITFLVNFRHVFYGLSFPIEHISSRLQKLYGIFALTDEIYGVLASQQGKTLSTQSIVILQLFTQFWWFSGAVIGVSIGAQLSHIQGFEFALIAMFLVLAIDVIRHTKQRLLPLYAAIAASFGLWFEWAVLDKSFLFVGILSYFVLLLLHYFFASVQTCDQP